MSLRLVINAIIFLLFLSIPIAAEFYTITPGGVPGTGFSVLLYEPFDFAYVILVSTVFVLANAIVSKKQNQRAEQFVLFSLFLAFVWFLVSLLTVGQLTLMLGGKL